jgi:hypothetical protein
VLKWIVAIVGLVALLTVAATAGLTYAVVQLSKESSISPDGAALIAKDSGAPLATGANVRVSALDAALFPADPAADVAGALAHLTHVRLPGPGLEDEYTVYRVDSVGVLAGAGGARVRAATGEEFEYLYAGGQRAPRFRPGAADELFDGEVDGPEPAAVLGDDAPVVAEAGRRLAAASPQPKAAKKPRSPKPKSPAPAVAPAVVPVYADFKTYAACTAACRGYLCTGRVYALAKPRWNTAGECAEVLEADCRAACKSQCYAGCMAPAGDGAALSAAACPANSLCGYCATLKGAVPPGALTASVSTDRSECCLNWCERADDLTEPLPDGFLN